VRDVSGRTYWGGGGVSVGRGAGGGILQKRGLPERERSAEHLPQTGEGKKRCSPIDRSLSSAVTASSLEHKEEENELCHRENSRKGGLGRPP